MLSSQRRSAGKPSQGRHTDKSREQKGAGVELNSPGRLPRAASCFLPSSPALLPCPPPPLPSVPALPPCPPPLPSSPALLLCPPPLPSPPALLPCPPPLPSASPALLPTLPQTPRCALKPFNLARLRGSMSHQRIQSLRRGPLSACDLQLPVIRAAGTGTA